MTLTIFLQLEHPRKLSNLQTSADLTRRYDIVYKQSVMTEDTFLGMAGKTPGSQVGARLPRERTFLQMLAFVRGISVLHRGIEKHIMSLPIKGLGTRDGSNTATALEASGKGPI